MSQLVALKIDLSKIEKARIFEGKNGAKYLDCVMFINEEPDRFGNCGMITQSISKEERLKGVKGPILGNGKILSGAGAIRARSNTPERSAGEVREDLPF